MTLLVKLLAITLLLAFVHSNKHSNKVLFLQKPSEGGTEALLVVTLEKSEDEIYAECEFFTDKDQIKEVLKSSKESPTTISENDMQNLFEDCNSIVGSVEPWASQNREVPRVTTTPSSATPTPSNAEATTEGYDGLPVIFPGTKWCGAGDTAKNYDDLGLHQDTDRCCRAHDLCNDTLAPGETRNKLKNTSPFTKLSCQCDHDFYNCLDRINSVTSNTIGNMYFNVLKRECYKADYPLTNKCKKYRTFLKLKCIEYEKNTKAPKVYQWIPAKKYKKLPFPGPLTFTLPF